MTAQRHKRNSLFDLDLGHKIRKSISFFVSGGSLLLYLLFKHIFVIHE